MYELSTFFHKDDKGKLRAGPIWDYNLAYGHNEFGNRSRFDVWQFDDSLVLCFDSLTYIQYYNKFPFGEYNRKLSNKSEKIVIADAWGNVIDEVHYYDSEPWPTEPDGNGPYLKLIDLDSDNSLAENWTYSDAYDIIDEITENKVFLS